VQRMKKQNQDTSTIGGRLRALRLQEGMTQENLAEVLHLENKSSISLFESDKRELPVGLLIQIAKHFHTSTDYILFGNDENLEVDEFLSKADGLLKQITDEKLQAAALAHLKVVLEYGA